MKIFVCYSTRDGLLTADELRRFSRTLPENYCVFIDLLHNNSSDVQGRIEAEIAICDLVVGLVTPAFRQSPWVRIELRHAKWYQKHVSLLLPHQHGLLCPSAFLADHRPNQTDTIDRGSNTGVT